MLALFAASSKGEVFRKYRPCKTLVLYGWGGEEQQRAVNAHQGRYICFDLGYWDREGHGDRHWRISLDGWHCPSLIMQGPDPPPNRMLKRGVTVEQTGGNPDGPILLIGTSPKSQKVGARSWTRNKCEELRKSTDKPIWYKPKPRRQHESVPADKVVDGDIFDVLSQVSLVVCRHSNVAVDAARVGVSVVCEDGAGAAIYPSRLDGPQPDYETRRRFVERVAYWQWSNDEIRRGECWEWVRCQLEVTHRLRQADY